MVEDHEETTRAVRAQVREILWSMSQLVRRVRNTEQALYGLARKPEARIRTEDQTRTHSNERSYLRAELEMSREMHARLEVVFERLLALLDANEAETYTRMHRVSAKL